MADYTQDQNDAYNDILAAGILATISRVSSTYDETEEIEVITAVQTDTTAVCTVPASAEMLRPYENRFIEDYKKGKIRFFLVAGKGLTFELEPGDLLYFDSKVWEVEGSIPLNPDGTTTIMFTMGVKPSNLDALPTVP
jgi:hypothetical protein